MALNPIDLQTMYSQLNNVAKQAASQQGVQLAQAMHQVDLTHKAQEDAKKVTKTEENSKSSNVNSNGHNNTEERNPSKNTKQESSEDKTENSRKSSLKESYLGQHIDITR